jgi:V/A-type H+-transporting ATPase subunit A
MTHARQGRVIGITGNMAVVEFDDFVMQNEVSYILCGNERLKAEVILVRQNRAQLQVYEDTKGLKAGSIVEFTGELLSVELGPGLLGQIFDGLQNPLPKLAESYGFFLKRGAYLRALDNDRLWDFTPVKKNGEVVKAGDKLGFVNEGFLKHWIMVPFSLAGEFKIAGVSGQGRYNLRQSIASLQNDDGRFEVKMRQTWPVKVPITAYAEKMKGEKPLVTKIRIIDGLMPIALGGAYCIPGPFGSGKTVLQQVISKHAEVDVVIIAACGERAGEVVETLRTFPELTDPKTGRALMERTVIICNTSSMPVAAREASVYTAVTIAEYYRQMGAHVLLLADSTSRWAQAMREMSGLLEEIPGEEAFPAYLESRIASFYERAGLVRLNDGSTGSVTIGGTISPAGGNFEEPVTQATLKVVGAFHGLSRDRANARKYPSIDPLESWSKYASVIEEKEVRRIHEVLRKSHEVNQMMMVLGEEGTSLTDFISYLKGEFVDSVYLQQNAFDPVDAATPAERQKYVFRLIHQIIETDMSFDSKNTARRFFQNLTQKFIEWNSTPQDSDEFLKMEKELRDLISKSVISGKDVALSH